MAGVSAVSIGPASSTGSPMTFMMRPSVSSPTGTEIGGPVSVTSWPRTRPSVDVHGDGAHGVLAEMLGDFEHQAVAVDCWSRARSGFPADGRRTGRRRRRRNDPPRRAVCAGSESRARTCDPLINSQLLCQLSYLGMAMREDSKRPAVPRSGLTPLPGTPSAAGCAWGDAAWPGSWPRSGGCARG